MTTLVLGATTPKLGVTLNFKKVVMFNSALDMYNLDYLTFTIQASKYLHHKNISL